MSRLEISNVTLEYPGQNNGNTVQALADLNLTIEGQEFVVALGPSGCGKTTLLNLLAGFISPTRGEILLDGRQVRGPAKDRGVVFQKHALLPWMSVIENAEFGLKLQGETLAERRKVAGRYLALVGIDDFKDHAIYQLSGGMQQRLGIARVLTSDPDILLMDEPFGALDALTRDSMQELILKVCQYPQDDLFHYPQCGGGSFSCDSPGGDVSSTGPHPAQFCSTFLQAIPGLQGFPGDKVPAGLHRTKGKNLFHRTQPGLT